jgi:hypothetical protein
MNNLKRDINLFAVIGQDANGFAVDFEKWLKLSLVLFGIIAVASVVLLGGINGAQKLRISGLNSDIAALEEPLARIEEYKTESEQLQVDIDAFKLSISEFEQQSRLTIKDIENIAYCMPSNVTLNSFSYNDDTVVLSCTGTSELAIADYANSLRNKSEKNPNPTSEEDYYIYDFDGVTYTGVSKSGEGSYTASITVTLKSRVVEEEPVEEAPAEGESEGSDN